jgi:hypothetical protein
MGIDASNARLVHFIIELPSYAKDVVLEEFIILKKTNANVKTRLYFSTEHNVPNVIIQNTLTLLITNAKYVSLI